MNQDLKLGESELYSHQIEDSNWVLELQRLGDTAVPVFDTPLRSATVST